MDTRKRNCVSPDKAMLNIDIDTVFVSVVINAVLLDQPAISILCFSRFGSSNHFSGIPPLLMVSFSLRVLRCYGTGTRVASMIWPPLLRSPGRVDDYRTIQTTARSPQHAEASHGRRG